MADSAPHIDDNGDCIRRWIRLILLLDAAESAGLAPIQVLQLHILAYMSNVLSPVWDIPVFDGKVLKRKGGPFYPSLQSDLDRLVGMGVVIVSHISHELDQDQRWHLEGSFRLHRVFADGILQRVRTFRDEYELSHFVKELAYALSALSNDDLGSATKEDATYADPMIDAGNVVDFAEWAKMNYSANAAQNFKHLIPGNAIATRGEMLHLYVYHLYRRLQNV